MWDTIQNISALAGAIATVYGLWLIFRGRSKLRVRADVVQFEIPRASQSAVEKFHDDLQRAKIEETYANEKDERIGNLINQWPLGLFGGYPKGDLRRKTLVTFELVNAGRVELSGLVLELPFDGVFEVEEGELRDFNKRIDIVALRPKRKLIVRVWCDRWNVLYDLKRAYVSHPGGTFPVKVAHPIYGYTGAIVEGFQEAPIFVSLFAIWLLCYVVFGLGQPLVKSLVRALSPATDTTSTTPTSLPATDATP